MAQKRKPDQTKLAAEAALFLAGKQGWDRLSLAAVAKKAKLPLKTVEASFDDAWDILAFSLAGLEKQTSAAVDGHLGDNWRDNLMEILMMRFELAQADREAYAAIGPSAITSGAANTGRTTRSFDILFPALQSTTSYWDRISGNSQLNGEDEGLLALCIIVQSERRFGECVAHQREGFRAAEVVVAGVGGSAFP